MGYTVVITPGDDAPDVVVLANTFLSQHFAHEATAEGPELKPEALKIRGYAGDPVKEIYAISGVFGCFMPHQIWGIWWALSHLGNGGLPSAYISDEMGLGKTKLSLGIMSAIKLVFRRRLGCTNAILEKSAAKLFQIEPQRTIIQQSPSLIVVPAMLEKQ
jgi:succinate dehydrogenase/fumarate reductase cytochrome b subunit